MPTNKPRLLDLFCGAGGCSVGYHRAGFDVVGVDLAPQPHYPFEFRQCDALEALERWGRDFDVIHASPPCQGYSRMRHLPWLQGREWPRLVDPCRKLLERTGKLWVIENVEGSPVVGVTLCGTMFGLKVFRHRKFESNALLMQQPHAPHRVVLGPKPVGRRSHLNDRRRATPDGWCSVIRGDTNAARAAMGIDWMNRDELCQAIPPAYTEYIGLQLRQFLALGAYQEVA